MSDRPDFLQFSPADVVAMGEERGADAASIAEALKQHRTNLESWGRDNAKESFWQGSAQLDNDTATALESLRAKEQQRVFQTALPDPRDQQEFVYQMQAGGFDPDAIDKRFQPLAKQMDEAWADSKFRLETRKIHGGSVDVNGVPLARYSLRRGTTNGKVDVGLALGDDLKEDFMQVDEVTDEDVQTEMQKSLDKAKRARDEAGKLTQSATGFFARLGDGGAAVLKSAAQSEERAQIEEARAKGLELGGQYYLLGERVREELKKPAWRDKVGQYAGGTEFNKGLLMASITTGAVADKLLGEQNFLGKMGGKAGEILFDIPNNPVGMKELVEAQSSLEQAFPGSTRRVLEGGIKNNSIKGAQQAVGQMTPYVAGGAIAKGLSWAAGEAALARQAAGRLGVAGAGMSVSAAGSGYLDTERAIAQALADGDTAKAGRIRKGQHWHALLTGLSELAVERLGSSQAFNFNAKGVGHLLTEIGKEGVEEPITGGIQRGIVDPLTIGRFEDVTGPMPEELVTGMLAAVPLVGGSAAVNKLSDSLGKTPQESKPATFSQEAPKPAPNPMVEAMEPDTGSFQEAQNAGSVTDPEPQVTLNAQRDLVQAGRKPAMIVDGVKVADLPPDLRGGLKWIDTQAGAVGFRADVYTEQEVQTLAEDPKALGKLLGYGVGAKPEVSDRVVVIEDADGNEVVSTAADESTMDEVAGSLTVMADPKQGQTVTVLPADQGGIILNQREANRKTEARVFIATPALDAATADLLLMWPELDKAMARKVVAGNAPEGFWERADYTSLPAARRSAIEAWFDKNDAHSDQVVSEALLDEAAGRIGRVYDGRSLALALREELSNASRFSTTQQFISPLLEVASMKAGEMGISPQDMTALLRAEMQQYAGRDAEELMGWWMEFSGRPTNDVLEMPSPEDNQQLESGAATRDKAGQQPGKEATPAVAAESAESAATEAKSSRKLRVKIPKRADGVPDILDWLSEQGAIQRPPPLKRDKMGRKLDQRGEHDSLRSFRESFPTWYRAVTQTQGRPVDVLAQVAFEENIIPSADPDVLIEAIHKAFEQRRHVKAEQRARDKSLQAEEKKVLAQGKRQDAAWNKANQPDKGDIAIASDEMIPGMVLDVDGEPMTVVDVEYDEDGNWEGALLEDGDRFGRQWVANGELVYADEVKVPEGATLEDDPFSQTETEPTEKAATEALFPEDDLPFNLVPETSEDIAKREAAQAAYDAQERAKAEEEARRLADQQQGRLFDGNDGRTGQTMASIKLAQLPRKKTPVGPVRAPGQLVTLAQIRRHLLAAVGLPRAGVGRFLQRALGIYKTKAETIRLAAINDIPTLAHEIGHGIHFRLLSQNPGGPAESWNGGYDAELLPLGQVTSSPNYNRAQVRAEGVAEFTRLWLTDPAAAMAAAPKFAGFWSRQLQMVAPDVLQGLQEGQQMIADYVAMPEWQKAKAQVVFDPAAERPSKTWGESLRRRYAMWVNTLQPALDTLTKIGEMDPTLAKIAARVAGWMENHRGGWQSKSHADTFINQTDLNGKVIGPSLKAILSDLQPNEHEDFSTYLAVKRARELQHRGLKSGFDHIKIPAAQLRNFESRFEATRQKLLSFQDNAVRLLVDSGLLSSEAYRQMKDANRDYVPFYRMYEALTGTKTGVESSRNGGGYVDNGTGIRRIKGSDLAIVDPLQSVMRNVFIFRKLAEQNHIGVQFFDLLQRVQGYGQFADDIAAKKTPTKVSHEEVVRKLIEAGVITNEADLPMGTDLAITMWKAMHRPDSKTGEVVVHKNGEAQHWELKDPLLYNALKTADADAVRFFKFSPGLTKILTMPTQLLRFTATAGNPVFALRNWLRDQVTAGVNSQTGYVPFWDGVIGAVKVAKGHPDYARWIHAGGKYSGLTTSDRTLTDMLEEVLPKDRGARAMMRGLISPRHIKRALMVAGEILEEATRVQEFSRATKQGKTDMEAANLSKIISMNFARAGETSRALNMVIAFFNAGIQDLDMVFRQHLDPKRRGTVMMKGLMYITLPSLLSWALGKDDEEIQSLPDWRKNFFWNFNLGPLAEMTGRRGFILSLPKPFLMGQLYGTMVERALDQATGRDPNGAKKAAWAILENSGVRGDVMSWLPTAIAPLVELATNKDTFRETPIVPDAMKHLPAEAQFTLQTSETAKLLGRLTGQSPLIIDHLFEGYTAGLGKMAVDQIDWMVTKIGAGEGAPGPSKDLFEYQPLKGFVGSPYEANAFVSRFYAASGDMDGLLKTWNQQAQLMTTSEQERFWKKKGVEIQTYQRIVNGNTKLTAAGEVRQLQKHLSEINKAMKLVQTSRTMAPAEKREKLMELSRQRNQAAEQGFKTLFPEAVRKRYY